MKHLASVGYYALASLLLAVLVQANIFPTTPVSSTRVPPGGVLNTQWIESNEPPFANRSSSYDLFLMTGGDLEQVQVSVIGTNIPISKTSVPFTLPQTLPPGAYFVKFVVGGQSVFSTRFIVTNADGDVVSTATDVNLGGFLNNATSTSPAKPVTSSETEKSTSDDETSTLSESTSETSTSDDSEQGTDDGGEGTDEGSSDGGDGTGKESGDDTKEEGKADTTASEDGNKSNKTASRRSISSSDTFDEGVANNRYYAATSGLAAAIAVLFLAALA